MTTRREFLKSSAIAAAASMAGVAGAPQFAFGQSAGGKTFIKVFMRGGADGLHLFPTYGDLLYYQHRPNIAIEPPNGSDSNTALSLGNGYRGMNPNLEPLMEIWDAGRMMVAPATALQQGTHDFCIDAGCSDNKLTNLMREIASQPAIDDGYEAAISANQLVMLDSIGQVQSAGNNFATNAGGLEYSDTDLGRGLRLAAQLLKAGVPLEVATMDWNIVWDTHSNQVARGANPIGDLNFDFNSRMRTGAIDFLTFYRDMSTAIDDVVVLVGTEFGRTVIENGSLGTDHGFGSSWFAFGGPTTPGFGPDITTLDRDELRQRRYVPSRTDYKDIVSEIMIRHMGMSPGLVSTIFPAHRFTDHNLFNRSV